MSIIIVLMTEMSIKETKRFLKQGTFTGKLATVKEDGSPHVVPIWFVLRDDGNRKGKIEDILLTTGNTSIKARNIQHDNRVSISVDDQTPPFSFVAVQGTAKIQNPKKNELLRWATLIAERYMGKDKAEEYGRLNGSEGAVLVRIKPTKIIAEKDVAVIS
jgi:PPOX class probable F420-dependent enzyme